MNEIHSRRGTSPAFGLCLCLHALAVSSASRANEWQGCYAGVHAGYAHGRADIVDRLYGEGAFAGQTAWNAVGDTISPASDGIMGGGQVGCDTAVAQDGLVAGLVADISTLDASASATSVLASDTRATFDADWLASARARLGANLGHSLVYVTGGVAFAHLSIDLSDDATVVGPGVMAISGSSIQTGWVVGAGAEWLLAPNLSLSLEYLHAGFGDVTATGEASNIPGAFPRFTGDLDLDVVRLGLNWRM